MPSWSFAGSPTYLWIARNLLDHGSYSIDGSTVTCFRAPLYPVLLAATMAAFGGGALYAAPLLQTLLGVITGVLAASLCASLFDSRTAGGLAAALYGAHPFLVLESFAERETAVFTFLVVATAWALGRMRTNAWRFAALGFLSALCHLTRPTGTLVLAAVASATLYQSARLHVVSPRLWLGGMALLGAAFLCAAAPWMYYTKTRFGRIFPGAACPYGQALYAANNPLVSLEVYPWIDWDHWTKYIWRPEPKEPSEYLAREDWYAGQAVEYMRAHPGKTALMAAARIFALYSPLTTPLGYGRATLVDGRLQLVDYRPRSLASRLIAGGYMCALYAGVVGYLRRRNDGLDPRIRTLEVFVATLFALLTFVHILNVSETRYRAPFDPLLVIFAARYLELVLRPALGFVAPGTRIPSS